MSANGLSVRGLSVSFGRLDLLRGLDLDIAPGETLVLFGPSGAGKTVLLRAIAGLEPAARARIHIGGRDISALGPDARRIGMAFQNFALYPHMPARENIASPLRARGLPQAQVDTQVNAVADLLRIGHVLGHAPKELSNGQKQRTALARALVGQPPVLLLDDPLRNVDAKLRYEMRLELPRLLRRAGAATIYVTQDYREAMALGDRVAILLDGGLAQVAPPDSIYGDPVSRAVARLFGDPPINLLPVTLERTQAGGVAALGDWRIPLAAAPGASVRALLGLRPEAIALHEAAGPSTTPAEVMAVTPLHERLVVLLRLPHGAELVASILGTAPSPGSTAHVSADAAQALLFDAETGARLPVGGAKREHAA